MTSTYFLETFGCQMNVLDSQLVEGQLRALGLRPVADSRDADIVLFNTCSVRQHAEDKVLSRLGHLKAHKRRRPATIIGVLGCMAEREKDALFVKAPHIDLLCGPGELDRLPALIADVQQRHERVTALAGSLSRRTEALQRAAQYDSLEALDLSRAPAPGENPLQAYVRVQRGCDKFCTYCVVPFTRGPERSRPPDHIVEEVRRLAAAGCREVTLLGQTVNSYVYPDAGQPVPFAKLLERVHAVDGIDRIRFVTSFPADWDEDIFRVMRDHPRIMPYLHIPAQSGSDRILQAMRRGYTVADYLKLMDAARHYLPHIALAGDFIVGFSGETEADFQASLDLIRRVEYSNLVIFKYSPRPGTAADRRKSDDVPSAVKARRNNEMLALQQEIGLRQKQRMIGQMVEVLVEGLSKNASRATSPERQRGVIDPNRARKEAAPDPNRAREQAAPDPNPECQRRAPGDSSRPRALAPSRPGAPAAPSIPGSLAPSRPSPRALAPSRPRAPDASGVQLTGRTPADVIAVFDADPTLIGALVQLRITHATPLTLFAQLESVISPARTDACASTGLSLPILATG